jgi:hypothetical protein
MDTERESQITFRWFWSCILLAIATIVVCITTYYCLAIEIEIKEKEPPALLMMDKAYEEILQAIQQHQGRMAWGEIDFQINKMLYERLDYLVQRRAQIALILAYGQKAGEAEGLDMGEENR